MELRALNFAALIDYFWSTFGDARTIFGRRQTNFRHFARFLSTFASARVGMRNGSQFLLIFTDKSLEMAGLSVKCVLITDK